ncbi:MAG TPA: hypothetical protein VMD02_00015 [Candidatus Omnitrophota bacterium]|nr:hypothetical protein [Candidatus Omnitrophota bacterium]
MSFQFFSFIIGMGAGVLIMSVTGMIASYMRLKRARARVDRVEEKLRHFQEVLNKKRDELTGRIEEEKKK